MNLMCLFVVPSRSRDFIRLPPSNKRVDDTFYHHHNHNTSKRWRYDNVECSDNQPMKHPLVLPFCVLWFTLWVSHIGCYRNILLSIASVAWKDKNFENSLWMYEGCTRDVPGSYHILFHLSEIFLDKNPLNGCQTSTGDDR